PPGPGAIASPSNNRAVQEGQKMKANLVTLSIAALTAATVLEAGSAVAQSFNSGSTGADGAFNPTTDSTLTLPPAGVLNFTTINIPSGVTVKFIPNVANTPVTPLPSGNVTIAGTIDVSGGPGGGAPAGRTLGPTGGAGGGGGGGGALLIASSGALTFTGHLLAAGASASAAFGGCGGASEVPGGGGGSGGAVRLIAATIFGAGGSINVAGGRAGFACNVGG